MTKKKFNDPIEWRLELYKQNQDQINNSYKSYQLKSSNSDAGIFICDKKDNIGLAIVKALIPEYKGNENTITFAVSISRFNHILNVLNKQKVNGFKMGDLIYDDKTEIPLCVIAANGTTFFAIQHLKS